MLRTGTFVVACFAGAVSVEEVEEARRCRCCAEGWRGLALGCAVRLLRPDCAPALVAGSKTSASTRSTPLVKTQA
jgi:hypothetical protein